MLNIREALVIIVAVAVLDGIWISANQPLYNRTLSAVQGAPMRVNPLGAVLSYVFIFLAFAFVVLPRLRGTKGTLMDCVREGGLVGLCIYGIYNFTNLATLGPNYTLGVALLDTAWGTVLFTAVAYALVILGRRP